MARGERVGRLRLGDDNGAITRRYHGFLIAAQPAPLGRMVVLNDLEVDIEIADGGFMNMREQRPISRFHLEHGPAELAI